MTPSSGKRGVPVLACAVTAIVATAAIAGPPSLPKGVEAERVEEGHYELTARVSSPMPASGTVGLLDTRTPLVQAARVLCPGGHALDMREGGGIRVVSGRFVATSRAIVRCVGLEDTATPPVTEVP